MAVTVLLSALALYFAALWTSARLALSSRRLAWVALALATALLALWRLAAANDVISHGVRIDVGTEVLSAVIAALIIVGIRATARAHAALRRSENRHRTVVESAMDAIVVVDDAGKMVYANAAAQSVFGYESHSLKGKPLTLLAPNPELAFERATGRGERRSAIERVTQIKGRHASGRALELEVSFGHHDEDGHRMHTGILRDVTARVELLEKLRRSEERYWL
ncbi:MAG TPA: PAS domain S-box protein, partial [Polyangiaceae bacterium]|nr:PAS domain S-box protein [Polyangiaceae bacterium]